MAGYLTGLAAIQAQVEKSSGSFSDQKTVWANIPAGGSPLKLIFLQEIDEGSPNYSEKNGLAKVFLEHSNPNNWRKKAKCTADEGSCFGCDQGWNAKAILYVNVLVDNGKDEPYTAVFSRTLGKGSIGRKLIDRAADEDFDFSITDKIFKFSRKGTTKDDTEYFLEALKDHGKNVEDYELLDLEEAVFYVKPEKQRAYYLDGEQADDTPAPASPSNDVATATSVNAKW